MNKSKSGFTIVELLIVIVVIGILAAITIVAYNGIQERARNITTVSGVKQYITALKMYAADEGAYPNTAMACIGEGYSYNGEVGRCGGNAGVFVNTVFDAALAPYLQSKPRLDTTNIVIYNGNTRAGGYYNKDAGTYGIVYYILAGTTASCDAGGSKALSGDPGVTGFYCAYSLPKP